MAFLGALRGMAGKIPGVKKVTGAVGMGGFVPPKKPAVTPGIGPSAGGAAPDMVNSFMGKMGMKQPMINQMNQKIDYSKLPNGGWSERPMRGPMNGPAINRGPVAVNENWGQMGGMQNRLRDMMGGNTGFNGGMNGPSYNGNPMSPDFSGGIMGGRGPTPQSMGGQAAPTPEPQEGVTPEPLPPGQSMGQLQPRPMGPSPDMMGGMFGGEMNRMRGPMFGGMRGRNGFNAGGGSPVNYLS